MMRPLVDKISGGRMKRACRRHRELQRQCWFTATEAVMEGDALSREGRFSVLQQPIIHRSTTESISTRIIAMGGSTIWILIRRRLRHGRLLPVSVPSILG